MAAKMKPVLIVEDEAIMRESLRDWLRDEGYEVETVGEGEEALQLIGEREFGIVVLDLRLPGRDGLEVFKEARERSEQLKGIIITAYPSVETAVEAMKLGAVDYVVKPFAPDALEKLIRQTLGPIQVEIKPKTILKRLKELPDNERLCHYAFKRNVPYLLYKGLFLCSSCEFGQMKEGVPQQELTKLAVRQKPYTARNKKPKQKYKQNPFGLRMQ